MRSVIAMLVVSTMSLTLLACNRAATDPDRGALPDTQQTTAPGGSRAEPTATPRQPTSSLPLLIFLGDSLTAGLGLDPGESFPSLIQARIEREGYRYRVVNAGVSGDTSAGGLRRLEWAMSDGVPQILVVALGGNDGLRGLSPEQLEENLGAIVTRAQQRRVHVLIAGMEAPPNFGADYTARFRAVFPTVAKRFAVPLIPFLLAGVAGNPTFNQSDGIHPNPRGAEVVANLVWDALHPTLSAAHASSR